MIVLPQFRNHPLRFLFYLNWILLSILFVSELFIPTKINFPRYPLINFSCLFSFAIMGLLMPSKKLRKKYIYIGLEFFLILLSSIIGGLRIFPFMWIVLVTRNSFILSRSSRLIITGFVFILVAFTQAYRFQNGMLIPPEMERIDREKVYVLFLTSILLFGLTLFFLQLLIDAVLSEHESRKKLALAHDRLREYALRIEDVATLQERNRIAREIHDSLGHSLTVFNLHVEAALKLLPSDREEATELLIEAKQVGATALKEVRQSVAKLRSDPLQGKSLSRAIASVIEDFQRSTAISPQCNINISRPVPEEVKIAAYRILQEALTNICKYAEATEVSIAIETTTELKLTVKDNGKGFSLEENTTGFGLQGMQERTKALGGTFQIITAPSQGCIISVSIPLPISII